MNAVDSASETNEVNKITLDHDKDLQNSLSKSYDGKAETCIISTPITSACGGGGEQISNLTENTDKEDDARKSDEVPVSDNTTVSQVLEKILVDIGVAEKKTDSKAVAETNATGCSLQNSKQPLTTGLLLQANKAGSTAESEQKHHANPVNSVSEVSKKPIKFSSVGKVQQVSIISKLEKPQQPDKTTRTVTRKRTEKFVVKNVSKVSKIYKASNLSYKIKPVLKNTTSRKCPIIYVGEPAFIDLEDFSDHLAEKKSSDGIANEDMNEESLYDIEKLQSAFLADSSAVSNAIWSPSSQTVSDFPPLLSLPPDKLTDYFASSSGDTMQRTRIPSLPNGVKIISNPAVPSGENALKVKQIAKSPVVFSQVKISSTPKTPCTVVQAPVTIAPVTSTKNQRSTVSTFSPKVVGTCTTAVQSLSTSSKALISVVQSNSSISTSAGQNMKLIIPKQLKSGSVMTVNFIPAGITTKSPGLRKENSVSVYKPSMGTNKVVMISPTRSNGKNNSVSPTVTAAPKLPIQAISQGQKGPVTIKCVSSPKLIVSQNTSKFAKIVTTIRKDSNTSHSESSKLSSKFIANVGNPLQQQPNLREGVEVAFEDGVRHFVSSLSMMTHLDDEPINSWSELKKGSLVAAKWTDGLFYDATVTGCYFTATKKKQPTVQSKRFGKTDLQKAKEAGPQLTLEKAKHNLGKYTQKKVGCVLCRQVFPSVNDFRDHQRKKCRSTGIIVPQAAYEVTDSMIAAVAKDKSRETVSCSDEIDSSSLQKQERSLESKNTNESPPPTSKQHRNMIKKRPSLSETCEPPEKKLKTDRMIWTTDHESHRKIFKIGTKFLHRWQLDGGESKWYHGRVVNVISKSGPLVEWEFEVSYKGEDDNYTLNLYEDYPDDIRIIGKM